MATSTSTMMKAPAHSASFCRLNLRQNSAMGVRMRVDAARLAGSAAVAAVPAGALAGVWGAFGVVMPMLLTCSEWWG
ncbi:hypothetical protein D3C72_1991880 [compost metagenome]